MPGNFFARFVPIKKHKALTHTEKSTLAIILRYGGLPHNLTFSSAQFRFSERLAGKALQLALYQLRSFSKPLLSSTEVNRKTTGGSERRVVAFHRIDSA